MNPYKPVNIEFDWTHNNPKDCQLFLALTGNREGIIEQLKNLIKECESSYGKPCQGRHGYFNCSVDVITPLWDGKKY